MTLQLATKEWIIIDENEEKEVHGQLNKRYEVKIKCMQTMN